MDKRAERHPERYRGRKRDRSYSLEKRQKHSASPRNRREAKRLSRSRSKSATESSGVDENVKEIADWDEKDFKKDMLDILKKKAYSFMLY